jgi:hypothetical protein
LAFDNESKSKDLESGMAKLQKKEEEAKKKKPSMMKGFCLHVMLCFGCYKPKKAKVDGDDHAEEEVEDGVLYSSEELALWVDMKARMVFPVAFVVFNLVYWFFAGRADCAIFKACKDDDFVA